MKSRCFVMCGLLAMLCALAPRGGLAQQVQESIVVVAREEYGHAVTHWFRAVVQARLPHVTVRFVPESRYRSSALAAAPATLVFRLDTSRDNEWRLRLEYRGWAFRRTIEGGLEKDAAAVEAAALMAARTSVALLMSVPTREPPAELDAWASVAPEEPSASTARRTPIARRRPSPVTSAPRLPEQGPPASPTRLWGTGLAVVGAYRGSSYAVDHPWTHGAKLGALVGGAGPCASLGYVLFGRTRIRTEFGGFDVSRQQGELLSGWCFRFGALEVGPRLGVLLEAARRSEATGTEGVGTSPGRRSWSWAGVSALMMRYEVLRGVQAFASVGGLFFLTDREFVAAGVAEPLLAPRRVRLSLDLGWALQIF